MEKKIIKPIITITFFAIIVLAVGVIGFIGLSLRQRAKDLGSAIGQPSPTPEAPALLDCAEVQDQWCIVSTGFDSENNLLITLKANRSPAPDVYALVSGEDKRENTLTCQVVGFSPDTVYCLGPNLANELSLYVQIRTLNEQKLLSAGTVILNPDLMAAEPAPIELPASTESSPTAEPTTTETDSYPDPADTAYPNSSYPSYP